MLEILQYSILLNIDLFPVEYHHVLMLEILQYATFVKRRLIPDRLLSAQSREPPARISLKCAYDRLLIDTRRFGAYDLQYIFS